MASNYLSTEELKDWINPSHSGYENRFVKQIKPSTNKNPLKPLCPELIEPKKIYVTKLPSVVTRDMLLKAFKQIGDVEEVKLVNRSRFASQRLGGFKSYAFIKFSSEEDTKRALDLKKLKLRGVRMSIKPAKILIKMPGFPDYVRQPLPDRYFDLEPLVPEEPTMHSLNDYVLLKIFDMIPFKELVPIERVCRRWQSLVYSNFKKRAAKYIQTDISSWMVKNDMGGSIHAFTKVLIYAGESVTRINLKSIYSDGDSKLIRIIGQLCPNLKSIIIGSTLLLKPNEFTELRNLCPKLEEFVVHDQEISSMLGATFTSIISALPELKILRLSRTIVQVDALTNLPKNLKVLQLNWCPPNQPEDEFIKLFQVSEEILRDLHLINPSVDKRIFDVSGIIQCHELEVLDLHLARLEISNLHEIAKSCPKMKVLKLVVDDNDGTIDWTLFKNLEVLCCPSENLNLLNILKSLPKLEHLELSGSFQDSCNTFHDFSQVPNLKRFELTELSPQTLNSMSLDSFCQCKFLEEFKFRKNLDDKRFLLKLIRSCANLKNLECPHATISGEDIDDFVKASKGRTSRLKLVIGLDHNALNCIEKLEEANYDVEMFDTFNLFSDDDFLTISDDDDDDDSIDFEDFYGYESDDSHIYPGMPGYLDYDFLHGGVSIEDMIDVFNIELFDHDY